MSAWTPTAAAARAAREALDVRANLPRSQRAGTLAGLARARQLADRRPVSARTVRRMVAFFQRNARFASAQRPSKAWQAWRLWGGDAARDALIRENPTMTCCNPTPTDSQIASHLNALYDATRLPEAGAVGSTYVGDVIKQRPDVHRHVVKQGLWIDKSYTQGNLTEAGAAFLRRHRAASSAPTDSHAAAAHAALARLRSNPSSPTAAREQLTRAYHEAVALATVARRKLDKAATAAAVEDAARYAYALRHYGVELPVPYQLVQDFAPAPSARQPDLFGLSAGPASMPAARAPRAQQLSMFSNPASVWDRLPAAYRPFADSTPADPTQRPWRVSHADRALAWLRSMPATPADVWTDYEPPANGVERVRVGLRGKMHDPRYADMSARLRQLADTLERAGWPVRLVHAQYDDGVPPFLFLVDDVRMRRNPSQYPYMPEVFDPDDADHYYWQNRDEIEAEQAVVEMVDALTGAVESVDTIERFRRDNADDPAVLEALDYLAAGFASRRVGGYILRRNPRRLTDADLEAADAGLSLGRAAMRRNPTPTPEAVALGREFGLAAQKLDKAKRTATTEYPRATAGFFREIMVALGGGVVQPQDILVLVGPMGVTEIVTDRKPYDPEMAAIRDRLRVTGEPFAEYLMGRAMLATAGPAAILAAYKRRNPSSTPSQVLARYVHGDLAHLNSGKIAQIHAEHEPAMRAAIKAGYLRKVSGGYMVTRKGRAAASC